METVSFYFRQADAIGLTTAMILLIMSIMTWSVILLKCGDHRRQRRAERRFLDRFWPQPDQDRVLAAQPGHALVRLAQAGLDVARRCARSFRVDELDAWVTRALRQALDAESAALEFGMTALATVGSTAPFVGLFGTVWSVRHALLALGNSGQATLDQVAGPVGEALVMTGAGLAVAIPAVIAYNLFTRANRLRLVALDGFAYDLHAFLLTGMPPPHRANPTPADQAMGVVQPAHAERG